MRSYSAYTQSFQNLGGHLRILKLPISKCIFVREENKKIYHLFLERTTETDKLPVVVRDPLLLLLPLCNLVFGALGEQTSYNQSLIKNKLFIPHKSKCPPKQSLL